MIKLLHNIDIKCWVLLSILLENECSVTEALNLLTILGASPSTARKLLFDLEDKNILTINLSNSDKRAKTVSIKKNCRLGVEEILNYRLKNFVIEYKEIRQEKYKNLLNYSAN
jgi:DNA-binding MarR family transcriptional regulator